MKIVSAVLSLALLALSAVSAMLRGQLDDLRNELRIVATMQQARGERITAIEAKAQNNASRIDRLDAIMDKQVQSNSQKIETLEERLRRVERTR
jgi:predicted  nucleic acid-binding Zn-ribbon protein